MNYVAIPNEIFESVEYQALTIGTREFLIRLYSLFGDCETFKLNAKRPEEYGEETGNAMRVKLVKLMDAGLLEVESPQIQNRYDPRPRVLKFKYSAVAAYQ